MLSFLNTVMFPNLQMKRLKARIVSLTVAWKQLGNCFEMVYVVQTPLQYHITLHMFVQEGDKDANVHFSCPYE